MTQRCEVCGHDYLPRDAVPCYLCWDRRASEADVDVLVAAALADTGLGTTTGSARSLLGEIGDPDAAPALRRHVVSGDRRDRARLISSLGWSGDPTDETLLLSFLADPELRGAALSSLTELGCPAAADLLAESLALLEPGSDEAALLADRLAWLGDTRALPALRAAIDGPRHYGTRFTIFQALFRLGDDSDRQLAVDHVVDLARQASSDEQLQQERAEEPRRPTGQRSFNDTWPDYLAAAAESSPADLVRARQRIEAIPGVAPSLLRRVRHSLGLDWGPLEPVSPRVVPSRGMASFASVKPTGAWPPAKFGGQPDWRSDPTWPLGEDGLPLLFYGQLPLPGTPERTGYIFIGGPEEWRPLGPGNALVVQPGPPCQLSTIARRTGPQLHDWVEETPARYRRRSRRKPLPERFVVFADWLNPQEWDYPDLDLNWIQVPDPRDFNKLGGTPAWSQGDATPPGDGWSFAFQFEAERAGYELADAATCYGFIHDDGRAAFGWDCA